MDGNSVLAQNQNSGHMLKNMSLVHVGNVSILYIAVKRMQYNLVRILRTTQTHPVLSQDVKIHTDFKFVS